MKNLSINNFDFANVYIRKYKQNDCEKIVEIIDSVCAECEWMSTKKFIPTPMWMHAFSDDKCDFHLLLVCEFEGVLVGWCRIFPEQCPDFSGSAELGIGILRDYGNLTIGSNFLDQALGWVHNTTIASVNLTTHRNNFIALHLFEKYGFKYVSDAGTDCFRMSIKV